MKTNFVLTKTFYYLEAFIFNFESIRETNKTNNRISVSLD